MNDELERNKNEQAEGAGAEETFAPRSKYERIMLAAAEAGRLNEEMRRKGIKLDHKVTIEAVLRVDEGKVRGTVRDYDLEEETSAPIPEMPASPLFGETNPSAPVGGEGENGRGAAKPEAADEDAAAEEPEDESEEEEEDEDEEESEAEAEDDEDDDEDEDEDEDDSEDDEAADLEEDVEEEEPKEE